MLNKFFGHEFPCITFIPNGPGYADITGPERICATTGAEAGSNVVGGASYLVASFNYYHSHMWRNLDIIFAFMVFFLATALVATEYIMAAKSKGEVLVFRRGHIPVQESKSSDDEESAQPVQQLVVDVDEKVKRDGTVSGLQKQTSIFHWEDVCYHINIKGEGHRLLDNVDGWVEPGTLTALMTSTVREALIFSAHLRQPQDVPDAEKVAYCSEVIRLLGMEKYADAVVGVPGEGACSGSEIVESFFYS
ncbi:hypothetical protein HHX47_DHR5000362 [Lentinula edodes]|nr:hypothetical protein HHX47_DHR5000362 [Lentinula edodes]